MKELELIKDLCKLDRKFKKIEAESASLVSTPAQHYLVVRLDGIGLSKKYLKNEVVNKLFKQVMTKAIKQTYYVLHRKSRSDAQQIFLSIIMASDEVSFILNTHKNYYDDRLFKIVTTIASTFSCFFTMQGMSINHQNNITGSFDGKPLILKSLKEVNDYIAYRTAIYTRNTMAKILRLNGVPDTELYNKTNNNNIDYYHSKFEQLNIEMNGIVENCTVFVPSYKNDKVLKPFKNKSLEN